MTVPVEYDFAILKLGDGATPTEVFTAVCGVQDVAVNQTAATSDRFTRDCAKPGEVPNRTVQVNGKQWDATASGMSNASTTATLMAALAKKKNLKIEYYDDDGTDAGVLLGTHSGRAVMTANNVNVTREGQATAELTFAGDGALVWTAAS